MIKHVRSGELIPAWYGVAWIDYYRDGAACLPVPMNWIVAIARAVWSFLRFGSRSIALNSRDAYRQGLRDAGK